MLNPKEELSKIDRKLSTRLHQSRLALGISREEVGSYIGVSGQQIAKYESGMNRISASSLSMIAKKLEKRVNYFFDGLNETPINIGKKDNTRSFLMLVKKISRLEDREQRRALNIIVDGLVEKNK